MIILTTQKVQIQLAGAKTTLDAVWSVSWLDVRVGNPDDQNGGSSSGVTNGATAVDVAPAPTSGYYRKILAFELNNADTGSITPSLIYNDGTNSRTFFKVTRATLEQLTYEDGAGFQCFSAAGVRQ